MSKEVLTKKELQALDKRDMQRVIGQYMNLPMHAGKVAKVEGDSTLDSMRDANVTVGDRIIMTNVIRAMNGDPKAAELLFKYGGYTPAIEAQVEIELPTIIDDMTCLKDVTNEVKVIDNKKGKKGKKRLAEKTGEDIIIDVDDIPTCDVSGDFTICNSVNNDLSD